MNKEHLRALVSQGQILQAIGELRAWLEREVEPLSNELLLLTGSSARGKFELGCGIVDSHDYNQDEQWVERQFLLKLGTLEDLFQELFPRVKDSAQLSDFEEKLKIRLALHDYTLREKRGSGKSVAVYMALDNTGKEVLVKTLVSNEVPLWEAKDEIDLLQGRTKHENVMQVLESNVTEFPYYLVAEYAKGNPLSDTLIGKHVPLYTALEVLIGICKGCQFLRKNAILAANFHPNSILMTENTIPLLSPFTLFRSQQPTFSVKHFASYATYQSPERLQQEPESIPFTLAEKADMFSVALIGYELLTGDALFGGETIYEVIRKRVRFFEASAEERCALLEKLQQYPQLCELFTRMLDRSVDVRPKNLGEVIYALERLQPQLSPQQTILLASYARCISSRKGDFVAEFYKLLFDAHPWSKDLFPDPARQLKKLRSAIKLILESGTDTSFVEQLPNMGRHGSLSLQNYKDFLTLLIKNVHVFDGHWDKNPEIGEAWSSLETNLGQILEQTLKKHPAIGQNG